MPAGNEKDEYFDVSDNMRTHSTMRFAQLTLFIAVTATLINVLLEKSATGSLGVALRIGGLLTVVVFWVMEERVTDYFHHYRRRAIELEKQLGYSQYTQSPQRRVCTATNAVRALFFACGIFWLVSLFLPSLLN